LSIHLFLQPVHNRLWLRSQFEFEYESGMASSDERRSMRLDLRHALMQISRKLLLQRCHMDAMYSGLVYHEVMRSVQQVGALDHLHPDQSSHAYTHGLHAVSSMQTYVRHYVHIP